MVHKRKQYILTNYTGSTMELLLSHAVTNISFHIIYNSFLNLKVYKRRIKTIVLIPRSDVELQELLTESNIKFQTLIKANLQCPNPQSK